MKFPAIKSFLMSQASPSHTLPWADWANLRLKLDWIYDGAINPIYQETREYIPGQSAFLIRQGGVQVSSDEGSVKAGPGEWLLLNEGLRWQKFTADVRMLSIRFHCTWPGGQPVFNLKQGAPVASTAAPELEQVAVDLDNRVRTTYHGVGAWLPGAPSNLMAYMEVQQLFTRWLGVYIKTLLQLGYSPSRFEVADPRVMRAVWILDHHPLNVPLPEAQLASQINLSVGQFARLFNQQFGISPFRYLERRRLTEAIERVRGSDSSQKAIAIDLGFNSLSHFSSWFRRKTKLSPSDFRNNY